MRGMLLRSIGALATVLFLSHTQAATIFSQEFAPADTNAIYLSDSTYSINYPNIIWTVADNFSLASVSTVRSVRWSGHYIDGYPSVTDDFTISIYEEMGGVPLPHTLVESFHVGNNVGRTKTGPGFSGPFSYEADLGDGVELSADTNYWIGIVSSAASGYETFWWAGSTLGDGIAASANGAFFDTGGDLAFSLSDMNVVPLPAPIWLFVSALGVLTRMREQGKRVTYVSGMKVLPMSPI